MSLWLACLVAAGCGVTSSEPSGASTASALTDLTGQSEMATWTCTGDPCPWGSSLGNPVLAWPADTEPVATRLGYTVSPAAYLPAERANGLIVAIDSGTASLYAGEPQADSHAWIATLSAGDSYQVTGLAPDDVLSVQSDGDFTYHLTFGDPPPSDPATASQTATWTCTGDPCPWGDAMTGEAVVWPDDAGAIDSRLGYTVSPAIYLPAARANGAHIEVDTGSADAYAGRPDDDAQRSLGTISAGQPLDVTGLVDGEVLSVQSDAPFTYRAQLGAPDDPPPPPPSGDVIQAIPALWDCDIPECTGDPWTGAVITWPAWAAYQNNARAADQSRSVFAADGTPLYPYMGAWADGCEVTAVTGPVLIIEWQRGTDEWRETPLASGQSHTIHLVPPEDNAMIETYDDVSSFSVTLNDCTPQPPPE
ncbi:MAG TPA: hypothetical protein VHW23_44445 [Kofleriaceae bacterium]|nr:hypothetical protein [Kofleriaceae bacterium]